MRGNIGWNYRPFALLIDTNRTKKPFICRLAPFVEGFELQWFDNSAPHYAHQLFYRVYGSLGEWDTFSLNSDTACVKGLMDEQDYEVKIVRGDGTGESDIRLVRTGFVPGTVVNYLHPEDKIYSFSGHSLCSPTLVRLPSGALLSAMDVYDGAYGNSKLTLLFKSEDNGCSWRYVCDIYPCFWPKLFVHRKSLYLLCCSQDYGDLMIGRSDDEGETWTVPTHIISGCGPFEMGPHKGPQPIIEHNGRLYTAIDYGCWRHHFFANGLLSINVDADLLDASSWSFTPFLSYDPAWPNAPIGNCQGCIEGNAVVSPTGVISNYLRIDHPDCIPRFGKAVVLCGDNVDPEAPLKLDRIVDCPLGSNSKFQIERDPITGKYVIIGTEQTDEMPGRTVLSMAVSDDFYNWRVVKRILDYRYADPGSIGFQYPDWIIDCDDILLLVRTSFNRARNFHDANYQCFMRIENFRQYL